MANSTKILYKTVRKKINSKKNFVLQRIPSVLQYNFNIWEVTCIVICGLDINPHVYFHRERTVAIKTEPANLFGSLQSHRINLGMFC